jgi:hypothetical protein
VNGTPGRASAWTTTDGLSAIDKIALDDLGDKWCACYDVGFTDAEFYAFRLIGGPLLAARTLAGLDSMIRADYARERRVAGYAPW